MDLKGALAHKKGAGAPRRISIKDLHRRVRAVPFKDRKCIRSLGKKVGIPRATLGRALKLGLLKTTKSHIKPILTPENKATCVAYCLSNLDQQNCFLPMFNRVDIDEKWFYLTQINTRYILVPGEKPPHRAARHKNHIPKAMCLTAMARPRKDPVTGVWWDGKIGTWFFVHKVAAKRGSKNLVTETYNVNKENSLDLYIDKLLPAIVEKWPAWEERVVRIQLDNAPVHPRPGHLPQRLLDHLAQLAEIGWDIDFNLQPPNSPDTNTLDLAFFRAIQTIQYQKKSRNLDELIANVEEAYDELPLDVCKHVWSTAQMCMNSIILRNGGNDYKLPHVGKLKVARLIRRDFPTTLPCQAISPTRTFPKPPSPLLSTPWTPTTVRSFVYCCVAVHRPPPYSFDCCIFKKLRLSSLILFPIPLPSTTSWRVFWKIYRFDWTTCPSTLESAMVTTLRSRQTMAMREMIAMMRIAMTAIWRASSDWDGGSISSTRLNISSIISPPSWSGVTRIITTTL